jgi:hypothetical protein
MLVRQKNSWGFNRSVLTLLSFMIILLGDSLSSNAQVVLRAPWEGSAVITQGNHGSTSHNICVPQGGKRIVDPNNCNWENTFALDIGLSCGSPVLAAADGVVTYTDSDPSGLGGRELAITHQGGGVTVYLHLRKILVTQNQNVAGGQIVAESGNSSDGDGGTGCHLHFHVWGGFGSRDSHTYPIERLILKRVGVDQTFREYSSRNGDLDDNQVAGKSFESDNGFIGTPCHTFTSVSAPTPFYAGYGVPWNVSNPNQLLLKAFCTSSSVTADVGPATYVWHQGYAWDGSQWNPTNFTCTGGALVSDVWCPNTAEATLPANTAYYVAYTCNWTGTKWMCGCADTTCSQGFWQLQGIQP